jgi:hypothetical protein
LALRALAVLLVAALALDALPPGRAEPTPGVSLDLDRVVPEPTETSDYLGYQEARGMVQRLSDMAPDFVEMLDLGPSFGLDNLQGGHDTFPVFAVEVTNERSSVPREQKKALVFQLSIHGNEKGGREGGMRVLEDLARPLLYGEDYRALLDDVIVVFTFPNVDGWNNEELPYRTGSCPPRFPVESVPCPKGSGYTRGNGRGADENRDWPTLGWYETRGGREQALSEPEMVAMNAYLLGFRGRTLAAADIHGMLSPADGGSGGQGAETVCFPAVGAPQPLPFGPRGGGERCLHEGHFVLGLMSARRADPLLTARDVRYAERSKAALNDMAAKEFPYWTSAPSLGYAGGPWMEWGTVWDTIGYTDSGFTGDWFGQTLGAAGLDYEMSYNHVVFDNHYVPEVNKMHVESVRAIVRAFLDEAREEQSVALKVDGTVAYLQDAREVTDADDPPQQGPHLNSTDDDAYEVPYRVTPQRFWRDLARSAPAGSVVPVTAEDLAAGRFHSAKTLVIAGDAWDLVKDSSTALQHLAMHLDQGKRIVLTDSAMRALEPLGLAKEGSVAESKQYLGYVDLARDHPLAQGVRGLARQTYDGVPLGFPVPQDAPVWVVAKDALDGADIAGTTGAEGNASLGKVQAGKGEVVFLGAVLPTPSEAAYHPYGLADYAVTYTGYQLLYNALGVTQEDAPLGQPLQPAAEPPAGQPRATSAPALPMLVAGAALLALALRRRDG